MGVKHDKHVAPDLANLVKEVEDVLRSEVGIAHHYGVVDQVRGIHRGPSPALPRPGIHPHTMTDTRDLVIASSGSSRCRWSSDKRCMGGTAAGVALGTPLDPQ